MDDTQRRGLVAQTAILNKLVQLGFEILFPYDSSLGYDLAYFVTEEHRNFGFFLHKESYLVRIQCKSAWLSKDGAYMEFNTHMPSSKKRRGEKRGYAGKAEYFGVYCPEIGKVYMVSVDVAPKTAMHLRFKSAGRRVGNSRDGFKQRSYEEITDSRIYWAEDFEI